MTSCSSDDQPDHGVDYREPETGQVPQVHASVTLPFERYQLSKAERTRMQEGTATLLTACMNNRGYEMTPTGDYLRVDISVAKFDPLNWGGPFGTLPLDHAKKYGYKPAPNGPFVNGPAFYLANPGNVGNDMSELGDHTAEENAFRGRRDGTGRKGCWQEIEDQLDAPLDDISRLEADLNHLAREHPRVAGAVALWRECMARAGYEYDDVWRASEEFGSSAISPRQIKVAVADVTCTQQSGWADYFYFVLADYQRQSIEQDPVVLESALKAEQERFAAVERELAREQ